MRPQGAKSPDRCQACGLDCTLDCGRHDRIGLRVSARKPYTGPATPLPLVASVARLMERGIRRSANGSMGRYYNGDMNHFVSKPSQSFCRRLMIGLGFGLVGWVSVAAAGGVEHDHGGGEVVDTAASLDERFGRFRVATSSPIGPARRMFDHAMAALLGGHNHAAREAFLQTARLDPEMPMAYAGIAATYPRDPIAAREAIAAALARLHDDVTPIERSWMDALDQFLKGNWSADQPGENQPGENQPSENQPGVNQPGVRTLTRYWDACLAMDHSRSDFAAAWLVHVANQYQVIDRLAAGKRIEQLDATANRLSKMDSIALYPVLVHRSSTMKPTADSVQTDRSMAERLVRAAPDNGAAWALAMRTFWNTGIDLPRVRYCAAATVAAHHRFASHRWLHPSHLNGHDEAWATIAEIDRLLGSTDRAVEMGKQSQLIFMRNPDDFARTNSPYAIGRATIATALLDAGRYRDLLDLAGTHWFEPTSHPQHQTLWRTMMHEVYRGLGRQADADRLNRRGDADAKSYHADAKSYCLGWHGTDTGKRLGPDVWPMQLPTVSTSLVWTPPIAPDWGGVDVAGDLVFSRSYQGRPRLLLFYLGSGCLHCAEQLQVFRSSLDAFERAGIEVIGISSDDIDDLKTAVDNFGDDVGMTLVSAAQENAFESHHCVDPADGSWLHATILVDGADRVRYFDIGPQPMMDAEFVLNESRRLLALPPSAESPTP